MSETRPAYAWAPAALLSLLLATPLVWADEKGERKTAGGKPAAEESPVPASGEARAKWIRIQLGIVRGEDQGKRRAALARLVKHEKLRDTLLPLISLLEEPALPHDVLVDVVRTLGIPDLGGAGTPLIGLLEHPSTLVRGNAAVSLEYIGSAEAVKALRKRIGKEKNAAVHGHLCRALGRCGAGDSAVRSLLLKLLGKADADFERIGPAVGLAYFEGDKSAARGIEKDLLKALAKKRKGAGVHRARKHSRLMGWCLGEIGDPKSARFLRKEVLPSLSRESLLASEPAFFEAVLRKLEGDASAQKEIDKAVYGFSGLSGASGASSMSSSGSLTLFQLDEMRKGRDTAKFRPKGDPPVSSRPSMISRPR